MQRIQRFSLPLTLIAVLAAVVVPIAVFAGPGGSDSFGGFGGFGGFGEPPALDPGFDPVAAGWLGSGTLLDRVADRLDLTDAQVQAIRDILTDHLQELEDGADALVAARQAQFEAIHAETFDEAAIRAAATQVGQATGDLAVTRAQIVQDVRQVLTPEQQAKADALRDDAKGMVEALVQLLRLRLHLLAS